MIRTAALAVLALGAMAAPALAFEGHSAPAPHADAAFTDTGIFQGMMPATASEPFHFGPAEPRGLTPDLQASKKPTVVYELKGGKPADRINITDPRDNPFMPQPERSSDAAR
jgi:hypothetical protein